MVVEVPHRFSLKETVLSHGWHQLAPFRWAPESSSLYRVESLPDGFHHALRIRQPGGMGKLLRIGFLGGPPGRANRRLIRSRVTRILNLDLDLSGFYRLCRKEAPSRDEAAAECGEISQAGH